MDHTEKKINFIGTLIVFQYIQEKAFLPIILWMRKWNSPNVTDTGNHKLFCFSPQKTLYLPMKYWDGKKKCSKKPSRTPSKSHMCDQTCFPMLFRKFEAVPFVPYDLTRLLSSFSQRAKENHSISMTYSLSFIEVSESEFPFIHHSF